MKTKTKTFVPGQELLISRSKLDRFLECPRCFYFEVRHNLKKPSGPPFLLNSFLDSKLKKEMDRLRSTGEYLAISIDGLPKLKPYVHSKIPDWRQAFRGIRFHHHKNITVQGAIDDLLTDDQGVIYTVDFKATATSKAIDLDDPFKQMFRRQVSCYNWLFQMNGFSMSKTGILIFYNAIDATFDGKQSMHFEPIARAFEVDSAWIESALTSLRGVVDADEPPISAPTCSFCKVQGELEVCLRGYTKGGGK